MDNAILQILAEYNCQSRSDYENRLKEIMQEIALLGLWRAKFYEHALFYGGSALRILFGLNRFSEDHDFSLLQPAPQFKVSWQESGSEPQAPGIKAQAKWSFTGNIKCRSFKKHA